MVTRILLCTNENYNDSLEIKLKWYVYPSIATAKELSEREAMDK